MSAIAVNGGHVARALDFYHAEGKYFILGGTTAWDNESAPPAPMVSDFRLQDVIGLKRVDESYLIVPDPKGDISHNKTNWRKVVESIDTYVGSTGVTIGSQVVTVDSVGGLIVGAKVRVNNLYDGTILSISGKSLTLDTPAPANIPAGSPVLGGALVDGAHYVYLVCYLNYDEFPVATYRQVGLCSGVPATADILLSANFSSTGSDEYTSLGILEILDNRSPSTRDSAQREKLSIIIEF